MDLCKHVEKSELGKFANSINEAVGNHDLQTVQNIMREVNDAGCNAPKDTYKMLDDNARDAVWLHNSTEHILPSGKFDKDKLIFGPQA